MIIRCPIYKIFIYFIFAIYLLPGGLLPLYAGEETRNTWITLEKDSIQELPLKNLSYLPLKKMKVALVLSGGGARGFAHIGVLKAFEENNIPVDLIVGTSIGSIVGGFYAAGFTADQIKQIIEEVDWSSIFADETYRNQLFVSQKDIPRRHILQFRLDGIVPTIPSSISQGQKVFQALYDRLMQANFQAANNFDNLKIPFRAVATDLISGQKVVLGRGDLAEAINASVAFPLLFAPVEIDGMWLVDGGITDNMPVDVAFHQGADVIVAVDATSHLRRKDEINLPWEIADQVTTIMMSTPTEESLQKADFVLRPELGDYKGGDFINADTLIQVGYEGALQAIDSLRSVIERAEAQRRGGNVYLGEVDEVKFNGLSEPLLVKFRESLKTVPGARISRADILSDLETMYESGFLEDAKAWIGGDSSYLRVAFSLKEQPGINRIVFTHNNVLPDSVLTEIVHEFSGKPLNIISLFERMAELKNLLIQQGHSLAQINSLHFIPSSGNLNITIDEGHIAKIKITGNNVSKDLVILREFPLEEEDLFQAELAIEGIQNIYSTNLFDRVLLNLEKENQQNTLLIKVKEKKYFIARLGAHVSAERGAEGFLELLADNFLGTATKVSLFGLVGNYSRRAEARLNAVRLYKTYLTSRASMYFDEREDRLFSDFEQLGNYQITRKGGRFAIGQQIERLGLISAELRIENVDVRAQNLAFPYQDNYRIRSFSIRSVVDKRDKIPFPERGIYNRWYWETGSQRFLESSTSFTKIFLGLEGYYPLFTKFNYHPYLFLGSADLTLPFSEFFFFGGQNNFPGLYEREILGRQFIQAGLDLRYRLTWKLPVEAYLMANYSVGAAWERSDAKIEDSDFIQSLSASLAINSLLGPLKFTYARVREGRELIQFSFGFDF